MNRHSRTMPQCNLPAGIFTARFILVFLILVFAVAACGCHLDCGCGCGCADDDDYPSHTCDHTGPVRLFSDPGLLSSVPYTIDSARIAGRHILMTVTVGGGCADHCYRLYVDEHFAESNPVQTLGYLVHQSDDPCDALLRHELSFDLQPLIRHHRALYGHDAPIIINIYRNSRREGEPIAVRYDP